MSGPTEIRTPAFVFKIQFGSFATWLDPVGIPIAARTLRTKCPTSQPMSAFDAVDGVPHPAPRSWYVKVSTPPTLGARLWIRVSQLLA